MQIDNPDTPQGFIDGFDIVIRIVYHHSIRPNAEPSLEQLILVNLTTTLSEIVVPIPGLDPGGNPVLSQE